LKKKTKMARRTVILTVAGTLAGALAGYLYYACVGCESGACPLTSQPVPLTLYGAFTGGLIFNTFTGNKKEKRPE
jgi:hypothetical protein